MGLPTIRSSILGHVQKPFFAHRTVTFRVAAASLPQREPSSRGIKSGIANGDFLDFEQKRVR